MKKIFFFAAAGVLLALSSCDKKDSFANKTIPFYSPAISILTDLNDGSVTVTDGYYYYDLDISMTNTDSEMKGTVSSPELIANNTNLSFTTEPQKYVSTGYDAFFENAQGKVAGNSTLKLKDAVFEAIDAYNEDNKYNGYYYSLEDVGELTYKLKDPSPKITVARYFIGDDYRVNTFQDDTFFQGTTTTEYSMMGTTANFETENILYRIIIDLENYKATAIMYNAKFSAVEQEPTKTVIIKDLDVTFDANGVNVSGTNLIPFMYSDLEGMQEAPRWIINNFSFNTTGDYYIDGVIDYTVAGAYTGHFEGSYIKNYYLK